MSSEAQQTDRLDVKAFRSRLNVLILASWNIPPIFGLSFLLFIQMLSVEQMAGILSTPIEPSFIIFWAIFSIWYFNRLCKPVYRYLQTRNPEDAEQASECLRTFPAHYWGLFITYLLTAPASVIIAAQTYTDFVATPYDWIRIHLVALIVSIIVGLPIFFMILDLFGRVMSTIPLRRPHVTLKMKIFLISALIPLLIDTMLVQYFWVRTGYFSLETLMIWLMLWLLAMGGGVIFTRSMAQSLSPLQSLAKADESNLRVELNRFSSQSTDEIGILAKSYGELINNQNVQSEILELNNSLLSRTGHSISTEEVSNTVVSLAHAAIKADLVLLAIHDEANDEMVGVAQNGQPYKQEGYYRLGMDEVAMTVMIFKACKTYVIADVPNDPRCSPKMVENFNVRSALGTPLLVEGRPIGVLMAITQTHRRDFTDRDVRIIESFAREAALAIHTQKLDASRLEAESKRKEQQEFTNLLMQSTEEGIYGIDVEGKCIFVNAACVRMLGYDDKDEILGKDMHNLIHHTYPDGTPYPKENCKVGYSTRLGVSGHSSNEVHWRKDGTSFPVEYWSRPIRENDKTVGAVVSFVDISERLEAENSRKESEAKYRALFESASDAIFIMQDLYTVDCNKRTLDLFNCSRDQFIGKTPMDFSVEVQPDGMRSDTKATQLQRKALSGKAQFFEWTCRRPDGSTFPSEVTFSSLGIDNQSFIQVVVRDISERKEAEETIRHMAFHDALTGLVNRHEFENRLSHAMESVKKRNLTHALLYLDLDQFKVVNDTCGHAAGDELLIQLALLIHKPTRERDTVARLGGDEFGILLENCPAQRAEEIANEIVKLVREYRFNWHGKTFSVGTSIGIALINDSSKTTGEVLKTADMACYMSKELGRNRVHLFTLDDEEMLKRESEMSLVTHIHDALDNDRFTLHYQPIVNLEDDDNNKLYGEILVRMINAEGEIIPADSFVASAERYNLMTDIDRWVINKTFSYAAEMIKHNHQQQLFFINLSGTSFNDESFLTFVQDQLTYKVLDPRIFCFEVTETAAIANISKAQAFIQSVKALGCRFALDDFGSGLSSFAYLKGLDIDFLKIDGSFVRDITNNKKDRAIVEAIAQLGRSMGVHTIAEFVESDEIRESVKRLGVDYAQGYGITKPYPLEKVKFD